jgi:hypothetical protein
MLRSRYTLLIIAVLLLLGGGYLLIFNWLVPKTAAFTVPMRWNRVPLARVEDHRPWLFW